jgi:hypothetical protein
MAWDKATPSTDLLLGTTTAATKTSVEDLTGVNMNGSAGTTGLKAWKDTTANIVASGVDNLKGDLEKITGVALSNGQVSGVPGARIGLQGVKEGATAPVSITAGATTSFTTLQTRLQTYVTSLTPYFNRYGSQYALWLKQMELAPTLTGPFRFDEVLPKLDLTGLAAGGLIGGSGYQDSVLRLLMPGEYVLRRDIVQQVGVDNLNRLNAGGGVGSDAIVALLSQILAALRQSGGSQTWQFNGVGVDEAVLRFRAEQERRDLLASVAGRA